MSDVIQIQYLNECGWQTVRYIDGPQSAYITSLDMKSVSEQFPGRRVRAVDGNERLIDIYN